MQHHTFPARAAMIAATALSLTTVAGGQTLTESWRATGANNSKTGFSLAHLGDLTGDGVPEFAAGGLGMTSVLILNGATGATITTINGPSGSLWFGFAVGAVNDTTLVIGDPAFNSFTGRVYVYDVNSPSAPLLSWSGLAQNDWAGSSVSDRLGDVNGDGTDDFGFMLRNNPIGGSDLINIRSGTASFPALSLITAGAGMNFATGPSAVGNVFPATAGDEIGVGGIGAAWIFGGSGTLLRTISTVGLASITAAGDLNADGTDDYATGESTANGLTGRVRVFDGATGAVTLTVVGSAVGDDFGNSVHTIGDQDGDAIADLIVGAPQVNSTGTGYAQTISSASGCVIATYVPNAVQSTAWFGAVVGTAGDIDGDLVDDPTITAPQWDGSFGSDTGAVFAYVGNSSMSPVGTEFCHCTAPVAPCGNPSPTGIGGCLGASGQSARLRAYCTPSVSADDLVLGVTGMKPNSAGLVFMGNANSGSVLGNGYRCVAGSTFRYQAAVSGPDGTLSTGPGLAAYSAANFPAGGQIFAGSTWHFQAWGRDAGGACAGATSNLSNAVSVLFQL